MSWSQRYVRRSHDPLREAGADHSEPRRVSFDGFASSTKGPLTAHCKGRLRWACDVASWQPSKHEMQQCLSMVQPEEAKRLRALLRECDRKSSLAGRLMIRCAIHQLLGIAWDDIVLRRTKRGKPYLVNTIPSHCPFPCFNFNVSHHGDWTVLACEPTALVGVDVMRVQLPPSSPQIPIFFKRMRSCFTSGEWEAIEAEADERQRLEQFYWHWTLKEAYIKAIGVGLGMELDSFEVRGTHLIGVANETGVYVSGRQQSRWKFHTYQLDSEHEVAVSLGPLTAAEPEYKRTLHERRFSRDSGAVEPVCLSLGEAAAFVVVGIPWLLQSSGKGGGGEQTEDAV